MAEKVYIIHALRDENGNLKNGKAGDQNGKEVLQSSWYLHKKGWVLLRPKSPEIAEKIVEAAKKAAKNPDIGYDQNNRYSLYENIKNKGFDPSKTTKPVETVCSDLVRICIAYAYGKDIVGKVLTSSLPAKLVKTGGFTKYTSSKYCKSSAYLKAGDILCTPVSGHVVIVISDGAKVKAPITVSILTIDGSFGQKTTAATQKVLGTSIDGIVSRQPKSNKKYLPNADTNSWEFKTVYKGGSSLIKAIQKLIDIKVDGYCGQKTVLKMQNFLNDKNYDCGKADGYMGAKTVKAWQKYINNRLK